MDRVRAPLARRRVPRTRLPLHRRILADPSLLRRWLLVVALAAITAGLVGTVLSRAEAARRRWGATRPVLVTTRPIAPGEAVGSAVAIVQWPVAVVPPDAIADLPAEATAAADLAQGVAVTAESFRDPAGPGSEDGRRIALAVGPAPIPLAPGDHVEVWATVDPSLAGGTLSTRRVAADATVASADDTVVVISVTPDDVPDVAEAAALATVTLVAVG